MCCGRCSSHSGRYPILPRLIRPFTRPMRKCPVAGNGSKAANQRANFAVSSPQRFIFEKWPCWALAQLLHGSIGSQPPGQLVGGKADGSLHQKNNYPKNILGEARTFFFAHNASTPVGSINHALGYFCRPAQTKVKPPPGTWAK